MVPWRRMFEYSRRLQRFLIKIFIVVSGHPTVEAGLASVSFARQIIHIYRGSGPLFTALYLKQCAVSLQRHYAGHKECASNPVSISLTRSGIPRIIPSAMRKHIRARSERGHLYVKLSLSVFSLAKVIKCAPPIGVKTFSGITDLSKSSVHFRGIIRDIQQHGLKLIKLYTPWVSSIPLDKGLKWTPYWKSIANDRDENGVTHTIFSMLNREIASYANHTSTLHLMRSKHVSPGALFSSGMFVPLDFAWNTKLVSKDLSWYLEKVKPTLDKIAHPFHFTPIFLVPGRLACVIEGAGKRRLFAIGNYIKQRLLKPVHDWAASVLKRIPMDGTFAQTAPLERLKRFPCRELYSFDLKSATDRWPLAVITNVTAEYFGPSVAACIVHTTLGLNSFDISRLFKRIKKFDFKRSPSLISFSSGQPLGYLGSWTLFALSHHFMVWLAAELVYPKQGRFTRYALLGDDIVIADQKVAIKYQEILTTLGVDISVPKSIISNNGTLEFAKRFLTDELKVDLSPVSCQSLASVQGTLSLLQFADKYKVTRLSTLMRLRGFGYRALGRLHSTQSRRVLRLKVASLKPVRGGILPLEWWIGRGKPLNPYLRGIIVSLILKELKPKELVLLPEDQSSEEDRVFAEYTLVRNWLQSWLLWYKWYALASSDPAPSLEMLFSAPMVSTSWKRSNKNNDIKKFGLLYKVYDIGEGWTIGYTPPCLSVLENTPSIQPDLPNSNLVVDRVVE
jgi:hypothetical protein